MDPVKAPVEWTVAYLGPAGTHSHLAAIGTFGSVGSGGFRYYGVIVLPDEEPLALNRVLDVVTSGRAGWGVIPYFNTTSGPVNPVYPALLDFEHGDLAHLEIFGCVSVRISQDLIGTGSLEQVQVVYSKKQALDQCANTLVQLLPNARLVNTASTAEGALSAEREGPSAAAVASKQILPFHRRLRLLKEAVQDAPVNITRFLIVRRRSSASRRLATEERRHTWLLFASSLKHPVLPKLMAAAERWGIASSTLSGKVVGPETFDMRFLMELSWPLDSLKVHFFLSDVSHLSPLVIGSPFNVDLEDASILRDCARALLADEGPDCQGEEQQLLSLLPGDVQIELRKMTDWRLFLHEPVSTLESVWETLGLPVSQMLNTQVFKGEKTGRIIFGCVAGDCRVDRKKITRSIGEECRRLPEQELVRLNQKRGAISPLTATDGAIILLDTRLGEYEYYFMGSGHQSVSIMLNLRHTKWPRLVTVADISQEAS